jgi:hypothetical protein
MNDETSNSPAGPSDFWVATSARKRTGAEGVSRSFPVKFFWGGDAAILSASCQCLPTGGDPRTPVGSPDRRGLERPTAVSMPRDAHGLQALDDTLAEGVPTGHPDMPQCRFEPDPINDLIASLQSPG